MNLIKIIIAKILLQFIKSKQKLGMPTVLITK